MAAHKLAAIFEDERALKQALEGLHDAGFAPSEVALLLKQRQADSEFVEKTYLAETAVARPLVVDSGKTLVVEEAGPVSAVTPVYDPVALSEPVSEAEAVTMTAMSEAPESAPAILTTEHPRSGEDPLVLPSAPEAVLRDPNALASDAAIGGLLGLLAGIGMLMIPGLGPVLAYGSVSAGIAALTSATAVGTTIGAIAGLLKDEGIPSERVEDYRDAFDSGRAILILRPKDAALLPSAYNLLASLNPSYIEMLEPSP